MAGGLARLEAIWRSPCFSPGHPAGRVVSESAWVGFEGYVPTTCWPQSPCCGWPHRGAGEATVPKLLFRGRLWHQMPCVLGAQKAKPGPSPAPASRATGSVGGVCTDS